MLCATLPERLDTEVAIIEGRSDKRGDSKLQKVRKTFVSAGLSICEDCVKKEDEQFGNRKTILVGKS